MKGQQATHPACVYRFFDAHDELLYIGSTISLPRRVVEHNKGQSWWREVDRATVVHYDSEGAARGAERDAIRAEGPKFNTAQKRRVKKGSKRMSISMPPVVMREILDEQLARQMEGESVSLAGVVLGQLLRSYGVTGVAR
jgi:predicted GIY-YIG superfamily endonuclease